MTNILSKIWEAIKSWFKTLTFKDYILIIAIIGLIICFFMYRHYKNELHSEQMKNSHYNEQFDYYVNKANEAYAA